MGKFNNLVSGYDELVLRQRIVLLLSFLSVLYLCFYIIVLNPISNKIDNLKLENTYLSSLYDEEREAEENQKGKDKALAVVSLNNKLIDLESEVELLNIELKKYFSISKSSENTMGIVRDLVSNTEGLTLKEIEQLPIEAIAVKGRSIQYDTVTADTVSAEKNTAFIYKHKIVIRLSGNYTALIQYLGKIESLSWGLFGQDIHYKVGQYPNASTSLILYSLSLGSSSWDKDLRKPMSLTSYMVKFYNDMDFGVKNSGLGGEDGDA